MRELSACRRLTAIMVLVSATLCTAVAETLPPVPRTCVHAEFLPLPPGYTSGHPIAIANDGTMVGALYNGPPVVWGPGGSHPVHVLPNVQQATAINNHGYIVGFLGNVYGRVVDVNGNLIVDAVTIFPDPAYPQYYMQFSSAPSAMNDNNVVAGDAYFSPTATRGVLYDFNSDSATILPMPPGETTCSAMMVNDQGVVIVRAGIGNSVRYYKYASGQWAQLPGTAVDINDAGQILGNIGSFLAGSNGYLMEADGTYRVLPRGQFFDMNNNGDFVAISEDSIAGYVSIGRVVHWFGHYNPWGCPVGSVINDAQLVAGGNYTGPVVIPKICNYDIIPVTGRESDGTVFVHVIDPSVQCPMPGKAGAKGNAARGTCPRGGPYFDAWTSHEDQQMCNNFGVPGSPAIPADFFEPGSEPFTGSVCLRGVPLGNPDYGDADTVIRRSADPFDRCAVGGPSSATVAIEVVALNLESIAPITVMVNGQPQQWDVAVDLSSVAPPAGQLLALKTHCNGGTFSSTLHVQPRFTFTKVGEPSEVRVLDSGLAGLPPVTLGGASSLPWVFDQDPGNSANIDLCSHFHPGFDDRRPATACDCNSNSIADGCDIESGFSPDCNANRVPDDCDIVSGSSLDCNGNHVPDECDIESVDSNHNGIPDECEPTSDLSSRGRVGDRATLTAFQNPSASTVTFAFDLVSGGRATLKIYDVAGRLVTTLVDEVRSAGSHAVEWHWRNHKGGPVSAGVYYGKLTASGEMVTVKAVVVE